MNLNQLTLAVSALFAVAGASAGTIVTFTMPLAPASPYFANPAITLNGPGPVSFEDTFSFTAPTGAVDVSGTAVSIEIDPFFNINNLQISLFDASDNLIESGASAEQSMVDNAPVAADKNYYFKVSGVVPENFSSGSYVFTAIAAPIPEPETYMLTLAALAAAGLVAARGRRRA
jgi:hypothetical protein